MLRILCVYTFIFKLPRRLEIFLRTSGARHFFDCQVVSINYKCNFLIFTYNQYFNQEFCKISITDSNRNKRALTCQWRREGQGKERVAHSPLCLQQSLKLPPVGSSATSVSDQRQKVPLRQVRGMYDAMPLQKYPCHRNKHWCVSKGFSSLIFLIEK